MTSIWFIVAVATDFPDALRSTWHVLVAAVFGSGVLEFLLRRVRTEVSIQDGLVTIRTGGFVTGSFATSDVLHVQTVSRPIELLKIQTKSGLHFSIPMNGFFSSDKAALLQVLSAHA